MPLGFSMVLPYILTPQSLSKFNSFGVRKSCKAIGYNWVFTAYYFQISLTTVNYIFSPACDGCASGEKGDGSLPLFDSYWRTMG